MADNNIMNNDLLLHYARIKNRGISLQDILIVHNLKNICIYGLDIVGKVFFEELRGSEINVICFIDREAKLLKEYSGIPVILPEESAKISGADAIIVIPHRAYYKIVAYMKHFMNCKYMSIRDIISESLSEQEFVNFSDLLTNKSVKLYLFNRPGVEMLEKPSLWEQTLMYSRDAQEFSRRKEFFEYLYKDTGIVEPIEYLMELNKNCIVLKDDPATECIYKNVQSPLINIINGYRFNPSQPETFRNTLYTFGDCSNQMGDDTRTFGNFLQNLLNENNSGFKVSSYFNTIRDISFLFKKIAELDLKKGDVIVYVDLAYWNTDHNYRFFSNLPNIYCYDLMNDFSRSHDFGEIFYDSIHMTTKGNKLLADAVFRYISQSRGGLTAPPDNETMVSARSETVQNPTLPDGLESELEAYKLYLKNNKANLNGKIGSIVMNCNPFTNGHKYLIEFAAKWVDFLYIFVVEEDKSHFPFDDRFKLVEKGTAHLNNVKVLRSGKFIISTVTFEGYFNKESMPETEIDASTDVKIFAAEIAPVLGISVRFAGQEPFCNVTGQYNRDMKTILPRFGIEFCEIERTKFGGEYISASYVRELIRHGDFEKVRLLVPDVTFEYIINR